MSLINGLLGGFNTAIDQAHARSDAKVKDQRETERAILTHLTTLDDRPDIQDRAISALAEWSAGAPPPKGGFLNRLVTGGDTAMHPAVRSVLDLLHTPGEPDVMAGRASRAAPATGASPTASPSGAAGGVSPVGPTPGSRGGMPVGGDPVGAPPPAVTSGPAVPIPGSAAQPARAATEPGGGPQSPAAGGSPTGAPPQVVAPPAGMAGVSFLPPDKTAAPPPVVNTPPQAGPPPNVANGASGAPGAAPGPAGAPLPVAGQPAGPDFSALLNFRPEDRQRLASQVHTDGLILEKGAEHDLQMRLWDKANPGAAPEARQAHENQLLGSTPKWTNVPGTVPAAALPVDAADFNGQFIPPEKRNGSFVRQVDSVTKQERFLPVAGPQPTATATNDYNTTFQAMFPGADPAHPTPTQLADVKAAQDQRAVALTAKKAQATQGAATTAANTRQHATTVMNSDGSFSPVIEVGVGGSQHRYLDPETLQPLADQNVVKAPPNAAIPQKLDAAATTAMQAYGFVEKMNDRVVKLLDDFFRQPDGTLSNNPLPVSLEQFLYAHGVSADELAAKPFDLLQQYQGAETAFALKGFTGARGTNPTMLQILQQHLMGAKDTPQLLYEKAQGMKTLIDDAKSAVMTTQNMKREMNVRPAGGGVPAPAANATVHMIDSAGVPHDVLASAESAALKKGWKRVGGGG